MKKKSYTISSNSNLFIIILSLLMACTSLSTDIYLPAMPKMQQELQGNVELTITGFLIGFAIGQLIWGAISDRIGRRWPLIIGMCLFIVGSIGCALSQNMTQIVFWRVFQALGACTGPMIARAMIRDLYSTTLAAQMLSTLTIIMAIAPIAGPLLGGQMVKLSSWHSIFWLLAGIGGIILLLVSFLPETQAIENRSTGSLKQVFNNYGLLLKNKNFMRYTLCVTFLYISIYAFIAGSPFVYITYYGIDEQHYGWLFALNILGIVGLSFVNRKLVRQHGIDLLLSIATKVAMFAGLLLLIFVYFDLGGVYSVIVTVFLFFSTNGVIAACATAGALSNVGEIAGSASALIGCLQYGGGIISSLLLAIFHDNTPFTMAWIIALFTVLSALTIFIQLKQSK